MMPCAFLQEESHTWYWLYKVVANSQYEELSVSAALHKHLAECKRLQDQQQTKLQVELLQLRGQTQTLQDAIAKRVLSISGLEQKLAALSLLPVKNVGKKLTKSPKRGRKTQTPRGYGATTA